jgi:hypothetical protein
MTLEEFQSDLEARLAVMSDEELRAKLEAAGCVFDDPWMHAKLGGDQVISVMGTTQMAGSIANSNELALAA